MHTRCTTARAELLFLSAGLLLAAWPHASHAAPVEELKTNVFSCTTELLQANNDAGKSTNDLAIDQLLTALPVCQKDALFLATLGQRLNRAARYLEAADHLERALMLAPDLKDAQFSYAIALGGSGDPDAAVALLADLLSDPNLPPELRAPIELQKSNLSARLNARAAPALPPWQTRLSLSTRVGTDSNLLGSPNLNTLAITLAGQTLVLPLDESYLARSGHYARVDAQLNIQHNAADGTRWEASASLRNRTSPSVNAAGSTQLDLLLERSHVPADSAGYYLNASGTGLQSQAGARYRAWGAALGAAWRGRACQARLGGEWQARDYLNNPVLSGHYAGLSTFWACEQDSGLQWLLGLKTGRDTAQDPSRPGGNQSQTSLRVAGFVPLARQPGQGLLLDYEHSQQTDTNGYSAALENGLIRHTTRHTTRLEYQHPLSGSAQWVLGAEWVAQTSSLELFRQHSAGAYTGVRVSW